MAISTGLPRSPVAGADTALKGKLVSLEDPSDYIYFFYLPDDMNENVEAQYNEESSIIGRSAPFFSYQSTGARTFEFLLYLIAEEEAYEEVYKRIRWLQSFCYPDYTGPLMRPPKKLQLFIGSGFVVMKGIIRSANVTWKKPLDAFIGYPMVAEIPINFNEVVTEPYDYTSFKPTIMRRREGRG